MTKPALVDRQQGSDYRVTALLASLLMITTIAAVVFGVQSHTRADKVTAAAQGEQARRAACYYVPQLVEFDYRNLDKFFNSVSAGATGDWKSQFAATAANTRQVLQSSQMVSEAGEADCGLEEFDGNQATVVVAVAQTLKSAADPNPRPAQVAMVAVMERHGDTWLCSKLNAPMFG